MSVVVDTSVFSLVLRRGTIVNNSYVIRFQALATAGQVVLLGAVRQELLSGLRQIDQYNRLRDALREFSSVETTIEDYELAAEYFNTCRQSGIQGANTDFLICAVAHRRNYAILTSDQDFDLFKDYLPIVLLQP